VVPAESPVVRHPTPSVVYSPTTTETRSSRADITDMAGKAAEIARNARHAGRSTDRFVAGTLNTLATVDSFDTANIGTEDHPNRGRISVP
jgi:hypothetical protein